MKIIMEIPDKTILATVSIATCEEGKERPYNISLGTFHIATADLKDGNTMDFKTPYDNRPIENKEESCEK